jgi:hypothetical protein
MRIPVQISPLAACEKDKNKKESQGVTELCIVRGGEMEMQAGQSWEARLPSLNPGSCWLLSVSLVLGSETGSIPSET